MYKIVFIASIFLIFSCTESQKRKVKVTEYETLSDNKFLENAVNLTWIKDIKPSEALERFGRKKPFAKRTLKEIESIVIQTNAEDILAGEISDDWVLIVEENSFLEKKNLLDLSKDTEVINVFWNVNGLAEVSIAKNGELIAQIRDIVTFTAGGSDTSLSTFKEVEGKNPKLFLNLFNTLKTVKNYNWKSPVFEWIADYVNTDLPKDWLLKPHESAID